MLKNSMNKTLIIGAGEIGKALGNILSSAYSVDFKDIEKSKEEQCDVINICYPYSKNFIKITQDYAKKYQAKLIIIHSTVPVGTTKKLGDGYVHSPINGQHANMAEELKVYPKFIGANNPYDEIQAEEYLNKAGFKTILFSSSEATELAKIMCTSYYGWNLIYMREMIKEAKKYNVPFQQIYTAWNNIINKGFMELRKYNYTRPIYKPMPGKTGGHCVYENTFLHDNLITKTIKEQDDEIRKSNNNLASGKIRPSRLQNRK